MAYYQGYVGYSTINLSVGRAVARSQLLALDSRQVNAPTLPALPVLLPGRISDLTRYPIYQPQYAASVYQRSQIIPARVVDQYIVTSAHIYQRFDTDDLPALLFRIEPVTDRVVNFVPPMLVDAATGQQVTNSRGDQLRFFSFLPRYISTQVSGALLEYWTRLDYNLEYNDIRMRIEPGAGVPVPTNNTLNMRRERFRERTGQNCWQVSRARPARTEIEFLNNLTSLQVCLNTTMKVDLQNNRFLKPVYNDPGCTNIVGYVDAGVPLDFFLQDSAVPVPSRRMLACIYLRQRLQDLAVALGVGLNMGPVNWQSLANRDLPWWWTGGPNAPQAGRRIVELPGGVSHEEALMNNFGMLRPVISRRQRTRNA
ncbi:hypothetical protein H2198_000821 [Neophaeococcomyces mojaviensis]|uniref:Uncharacterized protein n=1 Tax=Neophaeococcomyces mojaviensis TaxID=3383035 RepID=A0ACC3AJI7_9EURO|nr:hypothetical protein H2198_000821 [Knufia sp. JES_112]